MSWDLDKTREEFKQFYNEVVVENGPRYKKLREWPHLYVDFFNSLHDMNYTMGHITAIGLPLAILYAIAKSEIS